MWLKKLKFNKKDKADIKSLFKFLFPNVVKSHSNVTGSMKPLLPIPRPIPWSQLHGNVKMGPPNIVKRSNEVLKNIDRLLEIIEEDKNGKIC